MRESCPWLQKEAEIILDRFRGGLTMRSKRSVAGASCKALAHSALQLSEACNGGTAILIAWSQRVAAKRLGAFLPEGTKRDRRPQIVIAKNFKEDREAPDVKTEIRDTLAHEIAHYLAVSMGAAGRGKNAHGKLWKEIATMCGAAPVRTVTLKGDVRAAFHKRTKKATMYRYACEACGFEYDFTANRHSRVTRGQEYLHTQCQARYRLKVGSQK